MAKRFFIENITENKQGISPSLSLKLSSYSKKEGTYFLVELPTYIWIGKLFSATITAKNPDGTTDKQYKGDCTITENGAGSISPTTIVSTEWENGVTTKALRYLTSDTSEITLVITVTDDAKPWIMGSGKTKITNLPTSKAKIVFDNELYYDSGSDIIVINKDWNKRKTIPKGTSDAIGGFINYNGVLYYSIGNTSSPERSAIYKIINDVPILVMAEVSGASPKSIIKLGNYIYMGKMIGDRLHYLRYRPGNTNWIDSGIDGSLNYNSYWIVLENQIFLVFTEGIMEHHKIFRINEDGEIAEEYLICGGSVQGITGTYVFENDLYCVYKESYYGWDYTQRIYKRISEGSWDYTTITGWRFITWAPKILYENKMWTMRTKNGVYNYIQSTSLYYTEDGINWVEYIEQEEILSASPLNKKYIMHPYWDAIDFNDCLVGNLTITSPSYTTIAPIIEGAP